MENIKNKIKFIIFAVIFWSGMIGMWIYVYKGLNEVL